jgi:transposase
MGRPKAALVLSDEEQSALMALSARRKTAQMLAMRARIILGCAEGTDNATVARRLRVSPQMVCRWRARFIADRLDGLYEEPRPGAPRSIDDAKIEQVIVATLEQTPRGETHWSTRSMAAHLGLSRSSISRIWRAFGLKPHRSDTFKLSTDPLLVPKVRDIVGLYMHPPERAVVLCVDEKTQIQALNRTQPLLPLRPSVPERRSHDYARNGTTSLFAALDVATGKVIGECHQKHRSIEFKKFLQTIDRTVPQDLSIHVVLDNYATHKAPVVAAWLKKNPRFVMHFTPTYSSWLNQVERWFADLTTKAIKRGSHRSVRELEQAISTYLDVKNATPTPFIWTKSADQILASIARFSVATLRDHGVINKTSETGH